MTPEAKLTQIGVTLPPAPTPVAAYVPCARAGNLIYTSGQFPLKDGKLAYSGKVGADLSEEEGYQAARLALINCLAVLKAELTSLSRVDRVVKLVGWVNSATGFTRQPFVINGASELLQQVFGEAGRHARSAVGVSDLPLNAPVEIELIVEVTD